MVVLPFDAALAECRRGSLCAGFWWRRWEFAAFTRAATSALAIAPRPGLPSLDEFGAEFGFAFTCMPRVHVHGLEVSSSAIRERVAAGDMTRARWMLGRPFMVLSTQARGRGIGTRLLVPTVNLAAYEGLLPDSGFMLPG